MAGMPQRAPPYEGPLEVGRLYGGSPIPGQQNAIGDTVTNPANPDHYSGPYSHWGGESNAHIAEMQRQHNAYLRARGAPLPPEASAAQIGAKAGFAMAGAGAPAAAASTIPAPQPVAAMKGPSVGTTEIIPGATDWIRQLVVDALPSRGAQAAPVAASPAPGAVTKGGVSGAFPAGYAPPAAPTLLNRLGAAFGPPAAQPPMRPDGVRG